MCAHSFGELGSHLDLIGTESRYVLDEEIMVPAKNTVACKGVSK